MAPLDHVEVTTKMQKLLESKKNKNEKRKRKTKWKKKQKFIFIFTFVFVFVFIFSFAFVFLVLFLNFITAPPGHRSAISASKTTTWIVKI